MLERRLELPINAIAIAWHPDSKTLAAGGFAGALTVWDARAGNLIANLHQENGIVASLQFSPDGRYLAVGKSAVQRGGYVSLYETKTFTLIKEMMSPNVLGGGTSPAVASIAFTPDSKWVVVGGYRETGEAAAFSVETNDFSVFSESGSIKNAILAIATNQKTDSIATCTVRGDLEILDRALSKRIASVSAYDRWHCVALVAGPDGARLFTGSNSGMAETTFQRDTGKPDRRVNREPIKMWDANTLGLLRTFDVGPNYVQSIAVSHDGRRLYAAIGVGKMRVWDTNTGQLTHELSGFGSSMNVSLSLDDKYLAIAPTGERVVSIWRVVDRSNQ